MPRKSGAKRVGGSGSQIRPRWHFQNVFRNLDSFGKDVPAFNIKGETKVNTAVGGVISTFIITLVLIYASIKLNQLINRDNPNINETDIADHYSIEDRIDLNDINFRMAWSVEGVLDEQNRDDPRYVKWIVRMIGKENGTWYEKILPHHKCTEEDYAQFN